eukprot:TRINITY_DN46919_c0_g1_i1.p1 TRINITY_DN46919_c0_g1~~TRINITY_DN46919_c0_g1_i1.p1  ORF type:complete len:1039 (+),score=422.99 TRINITY_DN46919_c0_g1_i1:68-3184(+)
MPPPPPPEDDPAFQAAARKLAAFYRWKDPPKVKDIPELLTAYAGDHPGMFYQLGTLYHGTQGWVRARDAIVDWLANNGSKDPEGEGDKLLQDWAAKNPPKGDPSPVAGFYLNFYQDMDKKYKTNYFGTRALLAKVYEKDDPRRVHSLLTDAGKAMSAKQYQKKYDTFMNEQREWYHWERLKTRRWARDYYSKHNPTRRRQVDSLIDVECYRGPDGLKELQFLLTQRYEPQRYVDLSTWSELLPAVNQVEALHEFFRCRDGAKTARVPEIISTYPEFLKLCEELVDIHEGASASGYAATWRKKSPKLWPPWRHDDYPADKYPEGAPKMEGLKVPTKPVRPKTDFPSESGCPLSAAERKELEREIKRVQEEKQADLAEAAEEPRAELVEQEEAARPEIRSAEAAARPALEMAHKEFQAKLKEWKARVAEQQGKLGTGESAARAEVESEEAKAREEVAALTQSDRDESLKRQKDREDKEGGEKSRVIADETAARPSVARAEAEAREDVQRWVREQLDGAARGVADLVGNEEAARGPVESDEAEQWAAMMSQAAGAGKDIAEREGLDEAEEVGRQAVCAEEEAAWGGVVGRVAAEKQARSDLEDAEGSARAEAERSLLSTLSDLIQWIQATEGESAKERGAVEEEEEGLRRRVVGDEDAAREVLCGDVTALLRKLREEQAELVESEGPPRMEVGSQEAAAFAELTSWVTGFLRRVAEEQGRLVGDEMPERAQISAAETVERRSLLAAISAFLKQVSEQQQRLLSEEDDSRRAGASEQSSAWVALSGALNSFLRRLEAEHDALFRDERSARWRVDHSAESGAKRLAASFADFVESLLAPQRRVMAGEDSGREEVASEESAAFSKLRMSKRAGDQAATRAMFDQCRQHTQLSSQQSAAIRERKKLLANLEGRLLLPAVWRTTAPDPAAPSLGPSRAQSQPPPPPAQLPGSPTQQRQQTLPPAPSVTAEAATSVAAAAQAAAVRKVAGASVGAAQAAAARALRPGGRAARQAASPPRVRPVLPGTPMPAPAPPPIRWPAAAVTEL